jgi:hypothetical protein
MSLIYIHKKGYPALSLWGLDFLLGHFLPGVSTFFVCRLLNLYPNLLYSLFWNLQPKWWEADTDWKIELGFQGSCLLLRIQGWSLLDYEFFIGKLYQRFKETFRLSSDLLCAFFPWVSCRLDDWFCRYFGRVICHLISLPLCLFLNV